MKLGRGGLDRAPGVSSFFRRCSSVARNFGVLFLWVELVGCLLARSVTPTSANYPPLPANRLRARFGPWAESMDVDALVRCEMPAQ